MSENIHENLHERAQQLISQGAHRRHFLGRRTLGLLRICRSATAARISR